MSESTSNDTANSDLKKAIFFMLLSTLSFVLMNAFVKYLDNIPTFQLVFFRSLGSCILATAFILSQRIKILGNNRKLLVLRSFLGLTSMSLFFMSIDYLPIGTAVSLRYLAPIFAALFAAFLLKEKLRSVQWLLFIIAFTGVIILKGFDSNINTTGLVLVLIASILSGMVFVIIRRIGKGD
ncbi:MAG: DMT family transporter, partial [Eudoraea sp.]|nr:DMT family transporter [Eudoraea sp.]